MWARDLARGRYLRIASLVFPFMGVEMVCASGLMPKGLTDSGQDLMLLNPGIAGNQVPRLWMAPSQERATPRLGPECKLREVRILAPLRCFTGELPAL